MNIVVSNVKGGVGKTTTSVYLAAAAVARGWDPVVLVDADRQASSAEWLEVTPLWGSTWSRPPPSGPSPGRWAATAAWRWSTPRPATSGSSGPPWSSAEAVVIPTRAGGVEYSRVAATLDMVGGKTPHGVVICAARLGTNDLDEAVAWWEEQKVAIWGIIPERVGIASGPESRLYREGLDAYASVLKKALHKRPK